MNILIQNGTVIDPANGVHGRRNLWIRDDKIVDRAERADHVIDASGKLVCPGFLDIHMHEDPVTEDGRLDAYDENAVFACMLHMGVTTAVGGNCGGNKYHPADYLDLVDRDGAPVNVAMLAGHGYFREQAGCLDRYAPTTAAQRESMIAQLRQALDRGCVGISFGVRYQPGMDAAEIAQTAAVCQKSGKLVAAHIRDDAAGVFTAARELLDAVLPLGVPLQLSHIGSMAGFGQMAAFLRLVDEYRREQPRLFCDCYPYDAFSARLGSTTYDEGWLDRYGCGYEVLELCMEGQEGKRCDEETFRRVRRERPGTVTVCHVMHQQDVDLAFRHEAVMIGSDATLDHGRGHPRACGTFPRLLSRYVESGVLSMDEAIRRMTAMPAAQLGLSGKGHLAPGADADLVIFDPAAIRDRSTFREPLKTPSGMEWVFVNGKPALENGNILDRRAGKAVRR